jgi:signal transduction histidine kinase
MKLFTRYARINLLSTLLIFGLASAAFFFSLQYVLIEDVDDDLEIEQHEIELSVARNSRLPEVLPVKDQQISYRPVAAGAEKRKFSTIYLKDEEDDDNDRWRQLVFHVRVNEQWYEATVLKSLEATYAITRSILIIAGCTILLMLIVTLLINRLVFRRLWKPFYHTVETLKNFKLGQHQTIGFAASDVDEFHLLNATLEQSINKAEQDYQLLKEFTENASHEMQTPMAIIRSKLDLLVQDEQLSRLQSEAVQSANDAIQRMARLNQSLLLLSKIENHQFNQIIPVDIKARVEDKIAQFQELWQNKEITTSVTATAVTLPMNSELADILLNNLFSNAVRHTPAGGQLLVNLDTTQLVLRNTAAGGGLDESRLFNRFYKGGQSSDQHGLGLSIVKQICDVSGFRITYQYVSSLHQFTITF